MTPDIPTRTDECRVDSVYDGDTVRATCGGERTKIRLYCIDAPEMAQKPWGRESRDHLRRIVPRTFKLRVRTEDKYGRTVGEILDPSDESSVNLAMARDGQAAVYRRYCDDPRYPAAERDAQHVLRGIWGRPGLHQRPWEYRKR